MHLDENLSTPTTTNDELWRVQLASGEMRIMTIDALDEAFQAGMIDASTKVLAPGADTWAALGDVAGLEADAPDTAEPKDGVPSLSPMAADIPSSRAAIEAIDLSAYDPSLRRLPADFEIDENALKANKGRVGAMIGVGVVACVGLLFLGAKFAGNLEGTAASNAMRASAVAPPAAVDVMDIETRARQLTEDQKRRLLEADKNREARKKSRPTGAPQQGGTARPAGEKGAPFVNGGDKYDPLNGAL